MVLSSAMAHAATQLFIADSVKDLLIVDFGFSASSIRDVSGEYSNISYSLSINNRLLLFIDNTLIQANWLSKLALQESYKSGSITKQPPPSQNSASAEFIASNKLGWLVDPFISTSLSSPIISQYSDDGAMLSGITDPLHTNMVAGLAWQRLSAKNLVSIRIGIASNWYVATYSTHITDDPLTSDVELRKQVLSSDLVVDLQSSLDSIVTIISKTNLRYENRSIPRYTCGASFEARVRMWAVFGFIGRFEVTYDSLVSRQVFYRSSLSVGMLLGPEF